jgi:hypothetical protein
VKATLLSDLRYVLAPEAFAGVRIWQVPTPVRGSQHGYKYSLAYVVRGICVLRFDNEAGKGDHFHLGLVEMPYNFVSIPRLLFDFDAAIKRWRPE